MSTNDYKFRIASLQDANRSDSEGPDVGLQFQILHLGRAEDVVDFRDVIPIGCAGSDDAAIRMAQAHHDAHGPRTDLWFLRGAGIEGTEIHAGHGNGLHAVTRYRIVMVILRPFA